MCRCCLTVIQKVLEVEVKKLRAAPEQPGAPLYGAKKWDIGASEPHHRSDYHRPLNDLTHQQFMVMCLSAQRPALPYHACKCGVQRHHGQQA